MEMKITTKKKTSESSVPRAAGGLLKNLQTVLRFGVILIFSF